MTTGKRAQNARKMGSVQRHRRASDTKGAIRSWTELERERCEVLSRHVARIAGASKIVRDLRELMFGEPTLTVSGQRALQLLDSPAAKYLSAEWFFKNHIPFAQHEAIELEHTQKTGPGAYVSWKVRIQVKWPNGELVTEPEVVISQENGKSETERLSVPRPFGPKTLITSPDTWLRTLKIRCAPLCDHFLWSEAEAVAFVMTGQPPEIHPVTASWEVADSFGQPVRTEVLVRLQPFVSIDSVDRILKTVRGMLGRRLRPGPALAHRTLALFDFVEEQRACASWEVPPWSELVVAWDQAHRRDDWGYGGDRRNFRRDYERARRLLLEDYLPSRDRRDLEIPEARDPSNTKRGRMKTRPST